MPTAIFLILLAWSSPLLGIVPAGPRPGATASSRCDARSRMTDVCHVHGPVDHPGWPARVLAIVEDRDDDEGDGEMALVARPLPMTYGGCSHAPRPTAPLFLRHAVDRSPILRC